jgi:hypothetical protein
MLALFAASVYGCRRLDRKLDAWDRAQELLHAHQMREGTSAGAPQRHPVTADVFLAAMKVAENPGLVRFGPPFRKRRGWVMRLSENSDDHRPAAKESRRVAYLCPNGEWWVYENRGLEPATLPAPRRIDAILRQALREHELEWPGHEVTRAPTPDLQSGRTTTV